MGICAVVFLLCAAVPAAGTASPQDVAAALADPARPQSDVQLDALRKPGEIIGFAGLKPGDRIADFMPGNAYFTRIFSHLVGPTGRVYAFLPAEQLANCAPEEVAATRALVGDPRYVNVTVLTGATSLCRIPDLLDVVWTAQDYHDLHDKFMAPTDIARFNAAVFRSLKPGGIYLIIDHAAAPGSGLRDTETLHRIDPESIRAEVTAAGFVFEAESTVLRNPADSHALPVFDPVIRHKTDQVILKFRKPPDPKARA
jgi:predicted methyltransferase